MNSTVMSGGELKPAPATRHVRVSPSATQGGAMSLPELLVKHFPGHLPLATGGWEEQGNRGRASFWDWRGGTPERPRHTCRTEEEAGAAGPAKVRKCAVTRAQHLATAGAKAL